MNRTIFAQQTPHAIDAGVFHNDVICVGHRNCLMYHESAFIDSHTIEDRIQQLLESECEVETFFIKIEEQQIPLKTAISTYLFNSQLITLPNYQMVLIAPEECNTNITTNRYLDNLLHDSANPIANVHYLDVRESMKNGGGPACLRLRAVLNQEEFAAMNSNFLLNGNLYAQLTEWVQRHYRDRLHPDDLKDPQLLIESRAALDELTKIMQIGSFYNFQKEQTSL